jgi:DNA (cytosine-5)-methyltransferase 1
LERRTAGSGSTSWATPGASNGAETPALRPSRIETGRTTEYLGRQVAMWATPNWHDGRRPGADVHSTQGTNLSRGAAPSPTPTGNGDYNKKWLSESSGDGLATAATTWNRNEYPTPSATRYGSSQNEGTIPHQRPSAGTPSLDTWASKWATPTSRDGKDGAAKDANVPTNGLLGRQALRTPTAGAPTSSRAVLNPLFVEALMGFPSGWTDLKPLETRKFRRWRRSHSELLRRVLEAE